jgi:short-subunit dehydrogenase
MTIARPETMARPIPRRSTENVLVVGATSGIAEALCRRLAVRGCHLVLAGRSVGEVARVATDLKIRYGIDTHVEAFEALDFESHPDFFRRCLARVDGDLTGVILCHGFMADQRRTEGDFTQARRTIDVNLTSAVSLLSHAANYLEGERWGYIAVIGSVAGDRGRRSNYTYGAAKAGLATYLGGLRQRLHPAGVHVLTIKPGFVDTPMTRGLLDPKSPLVASPSRVARDIDRAIRSRKDTLYTPWFWWPILGLIRSLPESLFKRIRL